VKSPYRNDKSSDFDEIWYTNADFELDESHVTVTKYNFFKLEMADGSYITNR